MATWLVMRKFLPALLAAGTAMAATLTVYVETQHHARQLQVLRVDSDATHTARAMNHAFIEQAFDRPVLPDFVIAYTSFSKRSRG